MARDEAPPFARGETFYNGATKDPIFSDPINYNGREYTFEPNSPDGQDTGDSSGRPIRVRVVQNKSGINLLPKRLAGYTAVQPLECVVNGYYHAATDILAGVIDEFLPAAGVANLDFFYVVVEGPTIVALKAANTALVVGSRLQAQTGTSLVSADSGLADIFTVSSPGEADELARIGRSEVVVNSSAGGFAPAVIHINHGR